MNRLMFALLTTLALGGLAVTSFAQTPETKEQPKKVEAKKVDVAKLVGHWEISKATAEVPKGTIVEFTKDGKIFLRVKVDDKVHELAGTYKVDGNKLTVTMKSPTGKEEVDTDTIEELNDDKLVTKNSKGEEVFTRRK